MPKGPLKDQDLAVPGPPVDGKTLGCLKSESMATSIRSFHDVVLLLGSMIEQFADHGSGLELAPLSVLEGSLSRVV